MKILNQNLYLGGILLSVLALSFTLCDKSPVNFLGYFFIFSLLLSCGSKAYNGVYTNWIGPYKGHHVNPRSLGTWAVVSGATDGIGLEYCRQLASNGMNICLIARSQEKLDKVAVQLEDEYEIKTKPICVDFSISPDLYYERLETELLEITGDIGILVNNVGICYPAPEPFGSPDLSLEFLMSLINVNIFAALTLTKILLPGMVGRNKGAVVNIGSMSGLTGLPFYCIYSSTKSFIERFTSDLRTEYYDTGIIFQYQYPGYVTTKMNKFKNPTILLPNANAYVEKALKSLGLQNDSAIWPWHRFVVPLMTGYKFFIPGWLENMTTLFSNCFRLTYIRNKIKEEKNRNN